jgi:stage II sporulation protein AB (anti-sigma F factor)
VKTENAIQIVFPGISVNEHTARAVVSAFLVQVDPTVEELADIRTAVSEAVTNCIVHGYRETQGNVELHLKLLAQREIYIRIKDKGCGIPDVEKAMEPLFTTAPHEERAGLGFAVMQSFMDSVRVRSKPDAGTTVIMRKKLRSGTCRIDGM